MSDLTTLADVKAWIGGFGANTVDDAKLSALISACSADFERATKRPDLLTTSYTEVHQGDGASRITLFHWPITAVSALTIGGATVTASSDKILPGYYFDLDIDPERAFNLYLIGQSFTDGAPVKIQYSAGYAAVPADIKQAVNDWVAYRYKQNPNLGQTQSRSTEGESVQQTQDDAPKTALACIDRYARCIPSVNRRKDEAEYKMAARRVPRV
jgi:hypothetical protein